MVDQNVHQKCCHFWVCLRISEQTRNHVLVVYPDACPLLWFANLFRLYVNIPHPIVSPDHLRKIFSYKSSRSRMSMKFSKKNKPLPIVVKLLGKFIISPNNLIQLYPHVSPRWLKSGAPNQPVQVTSALRLLAMPLLPDRAFQIQWLNAALATPEELADFGRTEQCVNSMWLRWRSRFFFCSLVRISAEYIVIMLYNVLCFCCYIYCYIYIFVYIYMYIYIYSYIQFQRIYRIFTSSTKGLLRFKIPLTGV